MSRSIGKTAVCGDTLITPKIGTDHPAHRTNLVLTGGNSGDGDEVFQTKNNAGAKSHRMLQSGVMYCQAIEPLVPSSKIGAGLPFEDVRTQKVTWSDGTFQTTAATGGATPGMSLVATYVIPLGPGFVTPDLITAGALGEVGKWKIVVANLRTDTLVGMNFFYTRAGGAQLDGQQNGFNWSNGTASTNSAVTYPSLPIQLQESVDSVFPGLHNQLEIDIIQKTGDAGTATSNFSYTNTTGQFRKATRNFQTQPSRDITGFNIRGTASSNMQGTIYVYKYSSV